jgi:biopolymer transport protein ExbB/TolQ
MFGLGLIHEMVESILVIQGNLWSKMDMEKRLGFRAGRFTAANPFLSLLAAALLTGVFYGLMLVLRAQGKSEALTFFTDPFLRPGNLFTVVPVVFIFFFSMTMLFIKGRKVSLQRKAFEWAVVPAQPDFVLVEASAQAVLDRVHGIIDQPKQFILLNRIERALSNLRHLGQVSEVSSVLRGQAEDDENAVAASFTLLQGLVWAMPVLGFIGTVQGLSSAVGGFSKVLQTAGDLTAVKGALTNVTSGLATAFETTLVALVASLIVQLCITLRQRQELGLLDDCSEYCQSNVISKLRMDDPRRG